MTLNHLIGIAVIVLCSGLGYFAFIKAKRNSIFALIAILILGLITRIYISLDPHLHNWDEKYHALVAKHIIECPTKPTLYENPVLPYDYKNWTANHIWLEKGPIPFLLIGGSVTVFGTSAFSVRIPSIIVGVLSIYLTYLIGFYLFNERVGLIAAFLHSINGLLIELCGGLVSSDHVETLFVFLIELGVYLAIVYNKKDKYKIFISAMIGLVVGCAILTKWFPALLVFPLWFYYSLNQIKNSRSVFLFHGSLALGMTGLVVVPIYSFYYYQYPLEFDWVIHKFLFAYNVALEDHTAPWSYYLHKTAVLFGEFVYVAILICCAEIYKKRNTTNFIFLISWWLIPLVIFSFADTKRFTYILIAAPALFIIIGCAVTILFDRFRHTEKHRIISIITVLLLLVLPIRYSLERQKLLSHDFFQTNPNDEIKVLQELDACEEKTVIFNMKQNIEAMFYTDFIVYPNMPAPYEISYLHDQGYELFVLQENACEFVKVGPAGFD